MDSGNIWANFGQTFVNEYLYNRSNFPQMKNLYIFSKRRIGVIALLFGIFLLYSYKNFGASPSPLNGAWQTTNGSIDQSLIVADGYCMLTRYDLINKKFIASFGGPLTIVDRKIHLKVEFNSDDKSQVGKSLQFKFNIKKGILSSDIGGAQSQWKRTDDGQGILAGNWRITQRRQDGKMAELPLRARRTLKLLTGTRFQWAAINIETGEFSGTGGGTYTFTNGKYTEKIDFFSRDNSRVGASLSFDGKVENGDWIHSGLSSKGDPIYEVWSRMKE